ncbi:MAG: pyridoxamine 5'-phosphate oxidase family protein [Rhizobiaceae bacterium]|jgi:hypothetical protein|nr:pyridoxamine 5'-phosphate oxidase family protein [Rhizobiaceae bacterium]
MTTLKTIEELETLYGAPSKASLVKETTVVVPQYRAFIEASPFCTLATSGPEGLDCSPRGDVPGFVRVHDQETLLMPDRKGNNRVDSLKNIIQDPRVGLCFLVPGSTNCLRVNGEAHLSTDPDLKAMFAVDGKEPRSVIVIKTRAVYFQCGRAIIRSHLWDKEAQVDPSTLPSAGEILASLTDNQVGGAEYDAEWGDRASKTLW